jgi:hypothetical protein
LNRTQDRIAARVAEVLNMDQDEILSKGRQRRKVKEKSLSNAECGIRNDHNAE